MELPPPPGLLWVDAYVDTCVLSGGPIDEVEVELDVDGLGLGPDLIQLGWSEEAACHYGLLEDLFDMTDEADASPWAPTGFRVDGREVAAAVHLTGPGKTVPWATFAEGIENAARQSERPPPTPAEVRRLPSLGDVWELAADEADATEVDGRWQVLYLVVVVDAGGEVRATSLQAGELSPSALADCVFRATRARPEVGLTAGRPARVRVAQGTPGASGLKRLLKPAHVQTETGPTPLADDALDSLFVSGPGGGGRIEIPFLADLSDDEIGALLRAARGFFDAAPWERLRGDRYLAFRFEDGPWAYASVMGQDEVEPGISILDDWLALCRTLYHTPDALARDPLAADVDPADGVTLYPASLLHADDADRLRALGPPVSEGMYPVPARLSPTASGPSAWPPQALAALMEALPGEVARRRADPITSIKADVRTTHGRVTLRYPADGTEAMTGHEPSVEVVVEAVDHSMTPLDAGALRITGPASARLPQVNQAVRQALPWGRLRTVWIDGRAVWSEHALADDPAPTLDDLARAETVEVKLGAVTHRVTIRRLAEPVEEIGAEVAGG